MSHLKVICALAISAAVCHASDSPVDGASLVSALLTPETRLEAFRELYRRTERNKKADSSKEYINPEVVVCPQPAGRPLYIVLCDSNWSPPEDPQSFGTKNFDKLFPQSVVAVTSPPANDRKTDKVMFAFKADGRKTTPFGGDNLLNGYLADINGDGLIERVDSMNYSLDERSNESCEIVEIRQVVGEKAKPLLRVVINRNESAWGWDHRHESGGDVLQIGPKEDKKNDPSQKPFAELPYRLKRVAAEFRWNKDAGRYEGPTGSTADHFVVLDPTKNIWSELRQTKSRLRFADARPTLAPLPEGSASPSPTVRDDRPNWSYHSLAGKRDDQLLAVMTAGKDELDVERAAVIQSRMPDNFWELPPKEAALAVVEANRRPDLKATTPLAIDDLDEAAPPASGEVGFEWREGGCGPAPHAGLTVLKYGGSRSELVSSRVEIRGAVPRGELRRAVKKATTVAVSAKVARQIYETIWWMGRIRARASSSGYGEIERIFSTGDGHAKFWVKPIQTPMDVALYYPLSERWGKDYDRITFANFAWLLMNEGLEKKAGRDAEAITGSVGEPYTMSPDGEFVHKKQPPNSAKGDETEKWIERMLGILRNQQKQSLQLHSYVINALVPTKEPWRYPDPRIDKSLAQVVAQGVSAPGPSEKAPDQKFDDACWAGRALARRGDDAVFGDLMKLMSRRTGVFSSLKDVLLEGASLCALKRPKYRSQLLAYLEQELSSIDRSGLRTPSLFDAVWIGHFVELTPILQKLATASETEIESRRVSSSGSGDKQLSSRFHHARRILTVWKEEDALTRLKLATMLEAISYREIHLPNFLRSEYEALSAEEKRILKDFLPWLSSQKVPHQNLDIAKLSGEFGPDLL